jgi:hypothetical protein
MRRKKLKEKDSEMGQEMMVYVPTTMSGILKRKLNATGKKNENEKIVSINKNCYSFCQTPM